MKHRVTLLYIPFSLIVFCSCVSAWKHMLKCDNGVLKSSNDKETWSFNSSTQTCSLVTADVPSGDSPCGQERILGVRNLAVQGSGRSFRLSWIADGVKNSNLLPWQFKILFFVKEINVSSYDLKDCQYLAFLDTNHTSFAGRNLFQNCVYSGTGTVTIDVHVFSLTTSSCSTSSVTLSERSDTGPSVTFIDNTNTVDAEDGDTSTPAPVGIAVGAAVVAVAVLVVLILVTVYCIRKRNSTPANSHESPQSDDTRPNNTVDKETSDNGGTISKNSETSHAIDSGHSEEKGSAQQTGLPNYFRDEIRHFNQSFNTLV